MNITGIMNASRVYATVDRFTTPERTKRQDGNPRDNSAVKVTISDEARALNDAAQKKCIEQDLSELTPNELFTK